MRSPAERRGWRSMCAARPTGIASLPIISTYWTKRNLRLHSVRDLRIDCFPKDMSLMDEEKPKQVTSLETPSRSNFFRKFISDLYSIKDNLTVVDDYCLFSSELPFTTVDIYSDASYPSIHYSDDENEVVLVIILSSI